MVFRVPDCLTVTLGGLIAALSCAACSASSEPAAPVVADGGVAWPFVAQDGDFQGFCKWSSAPAMTSSDAADGVHGMLGPLMVYWNKSPPPGSTEFPVGTIILKESQEANALDRTVFAMAKRQPRGTGWNSTGADGWEWFSVQDLGNCAIARKWRGTSAPTGESYTNTAGGDCNGCHGQVRDNDYVWDEALQLSKF